MHIAAAHVFEAVFEKAHRHAEFAREIAHQCGVLDAALDAVAATNVDVVVHTHGVTRQAQGAGELIGKLGHLDGCPDIEDFAAGIPLRGDPEGFNWHR